MKQLVWILLGVLAIILISISGGQDRDDAASYPSYSSYVRSDTLHSLPVTLCRHTVTATTPDSARMALEDQFFMAENDITHGVNIHMYETMDFHFPPKGSIHWKDGKHYNADDIVWEEHSYGPMPTQTYRIQVLRESATPLRPANPYAKELYGY